MRKQKINFIVCPVCKEVISNIEVDIDNFIEYFEKYKKTPLIVVKCKRNHVFVVYLYMIKHTDNTITIKVREILPALACINL